MAMASDLKNCIIAGVTTAIRPTMLLSFCIILCLPASGFAGDLQQAFDSARIVQEFEIGSDLLYSVGVSDSIIALVLYNEDSSTVVVYDLSGQERLRYQTSHADLSMMRRADISDNGQMLLVSHSNDMEDWQVRGLSLKYGEQFFFTSNCGLHVSPSGAYLISRDCEHDLDRLNISTKSGRTLALVSAFPPGCRAAFVGEHLVAVADDLDSVGMVRLNGDVAWKSCVSLGGGYQKIRIAAGARQERVGFYSHKYLVMFDLRGNEQWRIDCGDGLKAVMFDDRLPIVIVHGYNHIKEYGYTKVIAISTGLQIGTVYHQTREETRPDVPGYCMEIAPDVLLVRGPRQASHNWPDRDEYWTSFFKWSDSTGVTGERARVVGAYYPLASDENVLRFLRVKTTGNPVIVEIDRRMID